MMVRPAWGKYVLMGGLGLLLGLLTFVFGTAWYVVQTLTRPKKTSRFASYMVSPFELGLPMENVVFATRDGSHQVSGWFLSSPDARTTILLCPGFRTRKNQVLAIARALWQAGHNVLAFEYFGHGEANGVPVTLGYRELADFLGAVDYAQFRAPGTHLGVVGYSMGAAIALIGSACTPEVEAVVADSAFATHASAVGYNIRRTLRLPAFPFLWLADHLLAWRAGYRFHQVEPLREVARLAPRPVLFIHGEKDTMVDPKDATRLYAAARQPKELWLVPNAEHCGAYFEERVSYVQKIVDFFERALNQRLIASASEDEADERRIDLNGIFIPF